MPDQIADLNGSKILFIAYFYPPISSTGVPGAMRTVKFIRNLTNGECHVLTTTEEVSEQDSALSHLQLPVNNEKIYRVGRWDIFVLLLSVRSKFKQWFGKGQTAVSASNANTQAVFKSTAGSDTSATTSRFQQFKDFIYNLCYFPDQAGPWILPAYIKGKKLVKQLQLDAIFATGSPWSGLLVGYLVSKATGIPLIVDFRDPWMNNPFHQSKGSLLDNWSEKLEKKIVEHASAISLNTEPLRTEFLERYPHLPNDRFFVMPNGFDQADFASLTTGNEPQQPGLITLCHAGFLYGVRDPAVLLNAIQLANRSLATQNLKICFRQIGDVQLAYDIRQQYAAMIADGSLLLESARPYQQCLQALSSADWVVNVQPATKSQIPSKLYDYLAINRPILNITPEDGALGQLVSQHQLGKLFGFNDEAGLASTLVEIAEHREQNRDFSGYPARSQFDYAIIARHLAGRLTQLNHN